MTGTGDSATDGALRSLGGARIARACCVLVVVLLVLAIAYGGVMVIVNYGRIAV